MLIRLVALLIFLSGYAGSPYQLTVDGYMAAYPKISLGMSKQEVIRILKPSQEKIIKLRNQTTIYV